jgi:pimeloyl-ACP methyl ester carboxylesterase
MGIVLCHGHNDSRAQFLHLLRPLHAAGFHLLLFDQRSMGWSPGLCTYGYREQWDTLAALEWLRGETGVRATGLLGVSMGGATALLAAARDPGVRAVVTDCAFARLEEMVERKFLIVPRAWRGRVGGAVRYWAERWSGAAVAEVDPEAALRTWKRRPLLVIQAGGDLLVPRDHAGRLAAAAGPETELWIVPGAGHARSRARAGREYVERISAFFSRHLET